MSLAHSSVGENQFYIVVFLLFVLPPVYGDIFSLTAMGGWKIELQAMLLFTALAVAGLDAGKCSIDKAWFTYIIKASIRRMEALIIYA